MAYPTAAAAAPLHTTGRRPNRATAQSPASRMATMKSVTVTTATEAVPGSTCATSVRWIADQS